MFYRTDEEIRFGNKYYKRFEDLLDDYSSLSTLSPPSFNEVFGGTIQHKN